MLLPAENHLVQTKKVHHNGCLCPQKQPTFVDELLHFRLNKNMKYVNSSCLTFAAENSALLLMHVQDSDIVALAKKESLETTSTTALYW